MTLTAKDVAEIMRLLEESVFDELELEIDGLKLSLKRGEVAQAGPLPVPAAESRSAARAVPESRPRGTADAVPARAAPVAADAHLHAVRAPLLGTFYRAPKPGAPPFVDVGSLVEEDSIVGIIEVMKLMNAVRAGVRGTVADIQGRDGELVEYGEALLHVRLSIAP